jgi:outer membrane lipoprotein carrier protein
MSTAFVVSGSETDDRISLIQKAYEGIKDIRGNFSQKSIMKDLNRTETFKGDFFIKPPMKMKWIYKGPADQDIIINKDTVLIYKKAENQAYRSRFDKAAYGQTPVALLGGFGRINDEFTATLKGDSLILRPKKPMGNITSIKVRISDEGFPIRSFAITDSYSNVTEIDLRDVKINTGIQDSIFDPVLPKGVNIFEQSY